MGAHVALARGAAVHVQAVSAGLDLAPRARGRSLRRSRREITSARRYWHTRNCEAGDSSLYGNVWRSARRVNPDLIGTFSGTSISTSGEGNSACQRACCNLGGEAMATSNDEWDVGMQNGLRPSAAPPEHYQPGAPTGGALGAVAPGSSRPGQQPGAPKP